MAPRIDQQVTRGEALKLTIDGREVMAFTGETLASVLFAEGVRVFNRSRGGQPRAPFCNMGTCFECRVQLGGNDGAGWVRACVTQAADGMVVTTGLALFEPALGASGED